MTECYIGVLFHIFYYLWGKKYLPLYGGLCYLEIRYIEVPLYFIFLLKSQVLISFKYDHRNRRRFLSSAQATRIQPCPRASPHLGTGKRRVPWNEVVKLHI